MVSNKFLAALAVELELYRHLRCGQGTVQASIGDFVLDLDELKKRANGAMNYWTEAKNPPKVRNLGPYLVHELKSIQCLADMVESYLGAVFVDSKYDYHQIERFFEVHIKRFFVDMKIYDTFANNHPVVSGAVFHHIALRLKPVHRPIYTIFLLWKLAARITELWPTSYHRWTVRCRAMWLWS